MRSDMRGNRLIRLPRPFHFKSLDGYLLEEIEVNRITRLASHRRPMRRILDQFFMNEVTLVVCRLQRVWATCREVTKNPPMPAPDKDDGKLSQQAVFR